MHRSKHRNQHFRFRGQKKDEKVLYLIEKHWVVHVPVVVYMTLLLAATLGFGWLFVLYPTTYWYVFLFVFWPIALLFLLMAGLVMFLNDRLDLLIVTDRRVVDVTQVRFLHRDVSEANLNQIQDVKGRVQGIISAVFGVGTIFIQTAARTDNFQIEYVQDPVEKARDILDISNAYRSRLLRENGIDPSDPTMFPGTVEENTNV